MVIPSCVKCQFYKTGLHLFDHCLSGYFETNFSQSFRFSMYEKKNLPQSEHFLWISKYLISLPFGPCVQCQQITSLFLCLQNNFLIKFIADLLNLKIFHSFSKCTHSAQPCHSLCLCQICLRQSPAFSPTFRATYHFPVRMPFWYILL